MSEFIERIMERPPSHRIGAWIGTVLLVSFFYWYLFHKSNAKQLDDLQVKVEDLESKIIEERRLARNLPRIREDYQRLDVQLQEAMKQLPDRREIPQLLASISDLAKDAGLQVSLFKPRPDNYQEFYVEVPVAVSVEGSFHQVATFFDEVAHLDRIVNISGITLFEPKVEGNLVGLKAECLATTFRFMDEEERAKRSAAQKKGRRR